MLYVDGSMAELTAEKLKKQEVEEVTPVQMRCLQKM